MVGLCHSGNFGFKHNKAFLTTPAAIKNNMFFLLFFVVNIHFFVNKIQITVKTKINSKSSQRRFVWCIIWHIGCIKMWEKKLFCCASSYPSVLFLDFSDQGIWCPPVQNVKEQSIRFLPLEGSFTQILTELITYLRDMLTAWNGF